MAYADASPRQIETRVRKVRRREIERRVEALRAAGVRVSAYARDAALAGKDTALTTLERRLGRQERAARRLPTQAEIWGEWRCRKNKTGAMVRAFTATGEAIAAGLLDETPRPVKRTPAQELLSAIDADREIRQRIGRVDVTGDSAAACWAVAREGSFGVTVDVFYRHGREPLLDLVPSLERVMRGEGWKLAWSIGSSDRVRRAPKMEAGVWLAAFTISRPVVEFPVARAAAKPKKSTRARKAA